MQDLAQIEESYKHYVQDLSHWIPDGILSVDIHLLQSFDLLSLDDPSAKKDEGSPVTRYFHVIESDEKITLINEQFVIWIVPDPNQDRPITYTLIALNGDDRLDLELAFSTHGIYNNSRLVLRVLEKFLVEIQENENTLKNLC